MVTRLLIAGAVMALCVIVHASGLALTIRWVRTDSGPARYWSSLWLFVRIASWIILLHIAEIFAWSGLYVINGALPDLQTAVYFSAVTYTTTGYGDVVLPAGWRLDGGIEALTGILMCGWSTAFLFTVVSRLYDPRQAGPC